MGTVYSVQKTKWDQNTPTTKIKTNENAGRVRSSYANYVAAAEQSDIHMFNLPNGARILTMEVAHAALGSSTTLSVGYAAHTKADGTVQAVDVDEYKAAAASTSAAVTGAALTEALGRYSVCDADGTGVPITVSLAGANGTGTISLACTWVID